MLLVVSFLISFGALAGYALGMVVGLLLSPADPKWAQAAVTMIGIGIAIYVPARLHTAKRNDELADRQKQAFATGYVIFNDLMLLAAELDRAQTNNSIPGCIVQIPKSIENEVSNIWKFGDLAEPILGLLGILRINARVLTPLANGKIIFTEQPQIVGDAKNRLRTAKILCDGSIANVKRIIGME